MQDEIAKKKIGQILRAARERAGLGVRELARKADLSHAAVSRLESGDMNLGPVVLGKVSSILSFTAKEHTDLLEAAQIVSARMRGASQVMASGSTDWDALCLCMIKACGHQFGVSEVDFFQGFGVKSGIWTKGYDLLIRLRDQTWLGFAIKTDEIRIARTEVYDHKALPKPDGKAFESAGGIILSLTQRRIDP
jgi:transcriptional regulator with XRE-family HTH domain